MQLLSVLLFGVNFVLLLAGLAVGLAGQTPPGLLGLAAEEAPVPTPRDWEKLGVSNYELRILDRFYRDREGIEGFHIAYETRDLSMAGILVQPHIEVPDEAEVAAAAAAGGDEEEEEIKYPMVVLSHGSPYGLTQAYREIAIELARRGYVVLAPSYRGRGGREGRSQGLPQLARGEVLDLLQLVQIGRQIEYVDTSRLAILGFGDGASTALLGIERSNVFRVAILASPSPFSGMAEYGYAGLKVLRGRSEEIFGRELSQNELMRELYYRDAFRNAHKITTPMLFVEYRGRPGAPRFALLCHEFTTPRRRVSSARISFDVSRFLDRRRQRPTSGILAGGARCRVGRGLEPDRRALGATGRRRGRRRKRGGRIPVKSVSNR